MSVTNKPGPMQALVKKVFAREENRPPYPTYANAIDFTVVGMDVFMDVGAVEPESVQAAVLEQQSPEHGTPSVNLNVLFRFGMTIQTALLMHQKLSEMIKATTEQMAASMPTITASTKQED